MYFSWFFLPHLIILGLWSIFTTALCLQFLFCRSNVLILKETTLMVYSWINGSCLRCVFLPHISQWGLLVAPAAPVWCGTPSQISSASSDISIFLSKKRQKNKRLATEHTEEERIFIHPANLMGMRRKPLCLTIKTSRFKEGVLSYFWNEKQLKCWVIRDSLIKCLVA